MTHKWVQIDSTYRKDDGIDTTIQRIVRDSLFTYTFDIRRTADPGRTLAEQNLAFGDCGDKPTLTLLHRGDTLASSESARVGEVRQNMDQLTVVFDNRGGLLDYRTVIIQVMNADGSFTDARDIENFTMTTNRDSLIWTVTFPRVVDTAAIPGDRRLQHASMDSIIVVFRNPTIPLDTLRLAVPFVSHSIAFYDAPGNPANARLYPNPLTVRAGDTTNLYAIFFDADGRWDSSFVNDTNIIWRVNRTDGNTSITSNGGVHGQFYSELAGVTYTVTAVHTTLMITQTIQITVAPADPAYLQIVFDTTNVMRQVPPATLDSRSVYEFQKTVTATTFYAIERDRFGNYINFATGASWGSGPSGNNSITATPSGDGSSALITRQGITFNPGLYVIAEKGELRDTIFITVVGESGVVVGPNPFIPGQSDVIKRLEDLGVYEFYRDIVGPGSGQAGGNGTTGVLVAATSPRLMQTTSSGSSNNNPAPRATIVIYDAVGNIVFRSKPGDIRMAADHKTFGFIWDGRNMSGRFVGPGTYLVRIVGMQADGSRFSEQKFIGVTK